MTNINILLNKPLDVHFFNVLEALYVIYIAITIAGKQASK